MYKLTTETEKAAYWENAESHAADLFRLAKDHRITYMTLAARAFDQLRPILEWHESRGEYQKALDFLIAAAPDCADKMLYLKKLHDLIDSQEPQR